MTTDWPPIETQANLILQEREEGVVIFIYVYSEDTFYFSFSHELVTMNDSSRYFVLPKVIETKEETTLKNLGFAFFTREDSQLFLHKLANPEPRVPTNESEVKARATWAHIKRVIVGVANVLESKERVQRITDWFQRKEAAGHPGDYELQMEDLFKNVIGPHSRVSRLCNFLNQNIILSSVVYLKKAIPTPMTRDVRTPDGWRIAILITPDIVYVTHTRREQALSGTKPEELFWYEWELRLFFDSSLETLHACRLKLTHLEFAETTSPEFRAQLSAKLFSGYLIIC
eukprot:TRINITY_DN5964_c0_g1_i1.p1 TRINITY_DN5964_c0_g1~~TRINITY_DN5964_c0_g1_i1.p1  ORF type:complete len:286 (+),score=54.51 TRINITY_DN5964_c0_g1_i1:372-1229(+)